MAKLSAVLSNVFGDLLTHVYLCHWLSEVVSEDTHLLCCLLEPLGLASGLPRWLQKAVVC